MTEQHSPSTAAASASEDTMAEQNHLPNERKSDDNSNPQQGASSRNSSSHNNIINNNDDCRPACIEPQQDTSSANVDGSTPAPVPVPPHNSTTTVVPPPRQSLKIPPSQKDARKLFVGGLPADITDEEFRFFFEQFGKVIDSIVLIDYETNRSRGFGFVTFEDPNVARYLLSRGHDDDSNIPPELQQQAITSSSGRMLMRDKWIEIKAAEPKAGGGGGGGRGRYGGSGASSRGGAGGRNRNTTATSVRNQQGGYQYRNAPFIPPPPGQAVMPVGDPYSNGLSTVPPDYGAPATVYHGNASHPQPHFPQFYAQHPPAHPGVYAPPYYYPAPVMNGGLHAYSYHHPSLGDPAAAQVHTIPDADPSVHPTAVPMMYAMMAEGGAAGVGAGAYPVGVEPQEQPVAAYGYVPTMPTTPAFGITPVPHPPPPPAPVMQQSVMQPVAPGIPSKDENGTTTSTAVATNHAQDASHPDA